MTATDSDALRAEHERIARRALDAWDLRVDQVTRVSVSENIAFRVQDADGKAYVLRLHRPGYHSHAELRSERMWTTALTAAGIHAPVGVPTRDGEDFVLVPVAGERRYAGLLEWVEGTILQEKMAEGGAGVSMEASFRALGEILAALHNQAVDWPLPESFCRHALDADGLMGEQPFWGRFWDIPSLSAMQNRRLEALRRPVYDILTTLGKADGTYSVIHADLHPGNIVLDGADLHVIDFDDAGFGWHSYDLAVALYYYRESPRYAALRDALLVGYRRQRALDDEVVRHLPLFELIRSLALIGWTVARPEHQSERTAQLAQDVERTADDILATYR